MELPDSWRQFIRSILDKSKGKRMNIPPNAFAKKLTTLFSYIFQVNWWGRYPWLLADEKVNPEIIKELFLRWLARLDNVSKNNLPKDILQENIDWESSKIKDLLTDSDLSQVRFNWIPALMARKFSREKRYLNIDNGFVGDLSFKHIYFNHTHECMSQLIRQSEKSGYF